MPALAPLTRLLQVRPASSPSYMQIYRFCSSNSSNSNNHSHSGGSVSAKPAFLTPSSGSSSAGLAAARGVASASSLRASPPTLDLGLNFATMDFAAVAKATQAAIARERSIGGAVPITQRDHGLEAKLDRKSEEVASRRSISAPPPPPAEQFSKHTNYPSKPYGRPSAASSGAGRGFAAKGEVAASPREESSAPAPRSSLSVLLRECVEEKNWVRAYQMFKTAVNQALRQVLIPSNSSGGSGGAAASMTGVNVAASPNGAGEQADPQREAQCFAALRKVLMTLPPASGRGGVSSSTRLANVNTMRGIMRWNGQHYYLLWKALLESGRVNEVRRVWYVMQQIGFVEHLIEERTVNTLMALLRRTSAAADKSELHVVSAAFPQVESFEERMEQEKEVRRGLMTDLEHVAVTRHFHLVGSNKRTVETIRIAEALRRVENAEKMAEETGAALAPEGESTSTAEEANIDVGDFNGLLRRSRSAGATQKVLQMMAKLNLDMGASTFASLIASLHNPLYVLDGHTAEELSAFFRAPSTAAGDASATSSNAESLVDAKMQYEAYKQERVETALRWFFECPKPLRTADVYNELLYLLRARTHWRDFDKVLVEMRGNAVVTEEEWPEATAAPAAASGGAAAAASAVLPPVWTTAPNGKTYELLIHRARYVHQWDVMWALYEEMATSRVRGTTRVYEVLLTEASRNPPRTLRGVEVRSGDAKASSEALMHLYDELRRNGGDVRSFHSTLNVVNAWTKSRAKMNRWE